MEKNLLSFYRLHMEMLVYGTRCQVYADLQVDPESEVGKDEVELREALKKIDAVANEALAELNQVVISDESINVELLDKFRGEFDKIMSKFHMGINKIAATEPVRNKLFALAMERQRRQQIEQNKAMVNPANLAGSPAGLKGATTGTINKNGEVTPVEEKKDVPQTDKPISSEENK